MTAHEPGVIKLCSASADREDYLGHMGGQALTGEHRQVLMLHGSLDALEFLQQPSFAIACISCDLNQAALSMTQQSFYPARHLQAKVTVLSETIHI